MEIAVTKMQGCGNDFVILDYDEFKKLNIGMSELAVKLCDRHFGIGADGLIIPNPDVEGADIGWFFYNSDGSTAQMCGNGIRCFSRYVVEKGLIDKPEFTVKTLAGIITPKILPNGLIRVKMSKPVLESELIPFLPVKNLNYKMSVRDKIFEGNAVSMGNPHFVIFIQDEKLDLLELAKNYGPEIETNVEFPEKTNVEFVRVLSHNEIDLRVWERGCGITLACGTGACASVVAGVLNGYIGNSVDVNLLGGKVHIDWDGSALNNDVNVYMTGPAEYVFSTNIDL